MIMIIKRLILIITSFIVSVNANIERECEKECYGIEKCMDDCIIAKRLSHAKQISYKPKPKSSDESDSSLQFFGDLFSSSETCGLRKISDKENTTNVQGRIVGGEDAKENEFPWQISMQFFIKKEGRIKHFCGGSIINENYILTAAHCLHKLIGKESKIIVKIGTNNWKDNNVPSLTVEKLIIHEGWDQKTQADDIALMKIKDPMKTKTNANGEYVINTICLPKEDKEYTGYATLSGWGQTGRYKPGPDWLQKIDLPIYDQAKCAENYEKFVVIDEKKICIGGAGGKDSCMGDSGGPLLQVMDGKTIQIGVVSFGFPCAVKDMPSVFTVVSKYIQWIADNSK